MRILKDKRPLDKLYKRRNRYDLQPDYQRDKVWNKDDKQKLLDTILNKWDIPKVYLNVLDEDNYEVVDGQQRLTTIYEFYDNNIELSFEYSPKYGGLTYDDLPDSIKDIFDDYEIDIVLIEQAQVEELKELFLRLQLGKPLNSGEKLNAVHGKLRDFSKSLTQTSLFTKLISMNNTRHAHLSLAGQLCLLGIKGSENHKFKDIESLCTSNINFNNESEKAKRIKATIKFIEKSLPPGFKHLKNRASVTTYFFMLIEMNKKGFDFLKKSNIINMGNFYKNFLTNLKTEIEKGSKSKSPEFVVYQSNVTQGADSSTSLNKRLHILRSNLLANYPEFTVNFELIESEQELIDLKKNETIKAYADELISKVASLNRTHNSSKSLDLFKATNDNFDGSVIIGKAANNISEFKLFIDSIYKLIYEGSGNLSRIPKDLLLDDSIYFDIKHLRTDFFHDIEHGKKAKVINKRSIIASIYEKYTRKLSQSNLDEGDILRFQKILLKNLNSELIEIEEIFKKNI